MQNSGKRLVLFWISGAIGTALFYGLYELIYTYVPFPKDYHSAFCWLSAYLISILWQMELHARLVFQKKITNYVSTLIQTYMAYGVSIALSTIINYGLTQYLAVDHRTAWGLTLLSTGLLNYFLVSNIMDNDADASRKKQ